MERMQFTESDIKDKKYLEEQIELEAQRLFSSTSSRGRSLEEIRTRVRQGKIAEVFLIETGKFTQAPDIYHDLIDLEGNRVEVKAYNIYNSNAPSVQNDLYRIRTQGWNKSKYMMLFQCKEGKYTFLEKISI
jgi:hypothetical protein